MFYLPLLWSSMALATPRLVDEHPILPAAGCLDPTFSADGQHITLAGPGYRGLYQVALSAPVLLPLQPDGITWRHRWSADGQAIHVAARGDKKGWRLELADGVPATGQPLENESEPVWAQDGDIYLADSAGPRRLTQGEDRFFEPVLSPDGQQVAFVGLSTGIHLLQLTTGRLYHGGAGTHPAWSPDSRWLLFEHLEDDGEQPTGGEIYALSAVSGQHVALTHTAEHMERQPAFSPDGLEVVFLRDDTLVVARWQEVAP